MSGQKRAWNSTRRDYDEPIDERCATGLRTLLNLVAYRVGIVRVTTSTPDDDVGALARTIARSLDRRVEERLNREGYSVRAPQRDVLLGLAAGDTHVISLAGRLSRSPQAISKAVTELECNHYVERGRDPEDGRARPLVLTERGEAVLAALQRARQTESRELTRWLGTRNRAELVRLLQHAAEHLRGLPPS
jgi:DNA-binding MarR family transcriptional regulator